MLGYLPALQAPNMRLDFSPIDDALGAFFKQQKERRQNNALVGLIDSLNGPGAQGPNMPANALSAQPAVPGPASTGMGPQSPKIGRAHV